MKILRLRFCNLNALYGEWCIDFTQPEFVSDGLFAIVGATGAGKTTLFDAICLALYGQTPRLDKISTSENEIMSRHTGECFAEVWFSTPTGEYLCHWSQRRARSQAKGKLQNPKHELTNARSGKIICNKIKEVSEQIERLTGLNFQRFTRAVLLAQGSFAAFLQAPPSERAHILEQITGTEIYSQLSMLVHERQREEKNRLDSLKNQYNNIVTLSPEEAETLNHELTQTQEHEKNLSQQHQQLNTNLQVFQNIQNIKHELNDLSSQEEQLKQAQNNFAPQHQALVQAKKAAVCEQWFIELKSLRTQQHNDQKHLCSAQATLPELQALNQQYQNNVHHTEQHLQQLHQTWKEKNQDWRNIRVLDQEIKIHQENVFSEQQRLQQSQQTIEHIEQQKNQLQCTQENTKILLLESYDYLTKHHADKWLETHLTGVQTQWSHLNHLKEEIKKQQHTINQHEMALAQHQQQLQNQQNELLMHQNTWQIEQENLKQTEQQLNVLLDGQLLREYHAQHTALIKETALLHRIADLEQQRALLVAGEACPLCGATEHPFTKHLPTLPHENKQHIADLANKIHQIETQQEHIKQQQQHSETTKQHVFRIEQEMVQTQNQCLIISNQLDEIKKQCQDNQQRLHQQTQELNTLLQPLKGDFTLLPDNLIEQLQQRLERWRLHQQHHHDISQRIQQQEHKIQRLDTTLSEKYTQLDKQKGLLANLQAQLHQTQTQRTAQYGDRSPSQEEHDWHSQHQTAEHAKKQADVYWQTHQQKLHQTEALIDNIQHAIQQRMPVLAQKEQRFLAAIQHEGFNDESTWQAALLSPTQQEALTQQERQLYERQTRLETMRHDREQRLADLMDKVETFSEQAIPELQNQLANVHHDLDETRQKMYALQHQLTQHQHTQQTQKVQQTAITQQQQIYQRWHALHDLMGSSDGNKFRQFAQGINFECVLQHANQQLVKMSDRYILTHDINKPLELNVIDQYQMDEIRSTKNLSGGESFIISLALALGLAQMAGNNVRVDSLFLDEGFGTLDDEALETALDALGNLRQEGKLIGVISHVSALKERIGTQIRLRTQTGGRSTIEGAGVSKLA